jgi:O-antigen/teichoic acid export membrane protein
MVGPALRTGAAEVTPWIAVSALFSGLTTYYLHTAFTLGRKTRLLLAAMVIPAVLNLALTIVLIPRFGIAGAMWATVASYAIGALCSYALGRLAMPLPLPWAALAKATLAAAGMALAVWLTPAFGGFVELVAKAAIGALVYGALALALDISGARSRGLVLMRRLQPRVA